MYFFYISRLSGYNFRLASKCTPFVELNCSAFCLPPNPCMIQKSDIPPSTTSEGPNLFCVLRAHHTKTAVTEQTSQQKIPKAAFFPP